MGTRHRLKDRVWSAAGIGLPDYDIEERAAAETKKVLGGIIFRAGEHFPYLHRDWLTPLIEKRGVGVQGDYPKWETPLT